MKKCKECGQTLPLTEFYVFRNQHGDVAGYRGKCRTCLAAWGKEWRQKKSKHCNGCRTHKAKKGFEPNQLAKVGGKCKTCRLRAGRKVHFSNSESYQRRLAMVEEYIFARKFHGMNVDTALQHISRGFGVEVSTLKLYGLHEHEVLQ